MIDVLRHGEISVIGRHPYASNAAYLVSCSIGDQQCRAIYKPVAGERALWDFPGVELAAREVLAFEVAKALELPMVPETVWRADGPFGSGSLQHWIEDARIDDVAVVEDVEPPWRAVFESELADGTPVQVVHRDNDELRSIAFLDVIMNNADRKGGHLLRDPQGTLWGVDHGVTFHAEPKLRTVLWGFIDERIPTVLRDRLEIDLISLPAVQETLSESEIEALGVRVEELRTSGTFPAPSPRWPPVPWPVF